MPGQPSLVQIGMPVRVWFPVPKQSNWLVAAPHGRWSDGTPCRHLTLSQAHPTQILSEEVHVGVWLRGAGSGNTITLREAVTTVALGSPSPGDVCLMRATIPT
jgi:hypothetical protein